MSAGTDIISCGRISGPVTNPNNGKNYSGASVGASYPSGITGISASRAPV